MVVSACASDPVVATASGALSGANANGVASFKGIPYAAPPVGDLRWRAPQPAPAWEGIRPAKAFGAACTQPAIPNVPIAQMSEDCLTLNVWTPHPRAGAQLPVVVIIPGGGFIGGSSSVPLWDGAAMAKRGIVVVSFDYRQGVFGFMAHPMLSKEDPSGSSGNYGLLDEIAALKWVQANIAAFGGDPDKVTIAGNSAGGVSALLLMASPMAKGLFRAAIVQSGITLWPPMHRLREPIYGMSSAEADGQAIGADIAALRGLSAPDLLARARTSLSVEFDETGIGYWPVVDGHILPDDLGTLLESGQAARIPVLIGSNADDGSFLVLGMPLRTPTDWKAHLERRHPVVADIILAQYPTATEADVQPAAARWATDWLFTASSRATARALSAYQPVHLYEFTRVNPKVMPAPGVGSFHAMEVPYALDNLALDRATAANYDEIDVRISAEMSAAWLQFIKTGDPNGASLTPWPKYDRSSGQHMEFGDRTSMIGDRDTERLDAFDLGYSRIKAAEGR